MTYDLQRFLNAQNHTYLRALEEIKQGKKIGHWMWYIFPQIQGLGHSDTSKLYALENLNEAKEFLAHPVLGTNLLEISSELLLHNDQTASEIFGHPDDLKLRSCMTLFDQIGTDQPVFQQILQQFFAGEPDQKTLSILEQQQS